jgi:hypothetical protein
VRGTGRRLVRASLAGGAVLCAAAAIASAVLPSLIEDRIRERLVREAAQRGVFLQIARVRFRWVAPIRLEGVTFRRDALEGRAGAVAVAWRPARHLLEWPREVSLEGLTFREGDLALDVAESRWRIGALTPTAVDVATTRGAAGRLELSWRMEAGLDVVARELDADALLTIRKRGAVALRLGRVAGRVRLSPARAEGRSFDLLGAAKGVRLASPSDPADESPDASSRLGAPMDVVLAAGGTLFPAWRRLELDCWSLETSGVSMSGAGALENGAGDVWADVTLDVPRFELREVLAASGLRLEPFGDSMPADLGTASVTAELSGHLLDPDSITVDQKLTFRRPAGGVPALAYLNGPFTHTVEREDGDTAVDVREGAPDFVPLDDVPPLFLRALTLSEDSSFWSHPGIDLAEIPVALATNWKRGERARGGSTITQQLVKNLFLSRRKSVARKLQEAALALLVESTVPKRRILEIYLNVIEWGPRLYGLRPAARRYFAKEPRDLTPKEMAFLVALIPGPVKYQRSFANGVPSRGLESLVGGVLAKLRSVDALSEEDYERARGEPLVFAPKDAGP